MIRVGDIVCAGIVIGIIFEHSQCNTASALHASNHTPAHTGKCFKVM